MASVLDLIRSQFGKKKPGPTEAELSALVEQPTPAHLWFTPEGGWPEPFRGDARPPSLLPTAADAPDLFLLPAPIGELQVDNLSRSHFFLLHWVHLCRADRQGVGGAGCNPGVGYPFLRKCRCSPLICGGGRQGRGEDEGTIPSPT